MNLKRRLKAFFTRDARPGQIAAGLAVGVFIGCTPLYGLQTLAALAVAIFFRLNKPSCIAGLWIHNPITMVPILVVSYKLGCLMLGLPVATPPIKAMDWHFIRSCAEPFLLGSIITGLLAAVPAYFICYLLACYIHRKRRLAAVSPV